ncbi:MAG: MMPL family transporter [Dehalococcoidia bacterium]
MENLAVYCARNPLKVIFTWLLIFSLSIYLNIAFLEDGLTTEFTFITNPESEKGQEALIDLTGPRLASELIVIKSDTFKVDSPEFEKVVTSIQTDLNDLGSDTVKNSYSYYQTKDPQSVSIDQNATLIGLTMAINVDAGIKNIPKVIEIVNKYNEELNFQVLILGEASIASASNELSEEDLIRGESIGGSVALVILILVFGGVVAGVLPVILALLGIVIATGLVAIIGNIYQLSFFITNMVTMIGLAVGIDYTLFIISRYREERNQDFDKYEAVRRTAATATRSVVISGITVMLALLGIVIVPTLVFVSLGIGALIVVVVSIMISLTLLPSIIGLLGDKLNSLKVPFLNSKASQSDDITSSANLWVRFAGFVMKFPIISLIVVLLVLVPISMQTTSLVTGANGIETMPEDMDIVKAYNILTEDFSYGSISTQDLVVSGSFTQELLDESVIKLDQLVQNDPDLIGILGTPQINETNDVALIRIATASVVGSSQSENTVIRLRDSIVPNAFSEMDASIYVSGEHAFYADFYQMVDQFTPYVFALVLTLSFILLTMTFRSIVIPIKAVLMNLLSVGVAYGLLVLVFQKGYGSDLLGFQQTDIIEAWIPLFLFCVVFGLSMDYHVFLLSRVKEFYNKTKDNTLAVSYGLSSTATIITGAGLIMVAVFGGFALGEMLMMQQIGFGLLVAILLDSTIIRIILVPASMKLLGEYNWYMPKWLEWLPTVKFEAEN